MEMVMKAKLLLRYLCADYMIEFGGGTSKVDFDEVCELHSLDLARSNYIHRAPEKL